MKLARTLFFVFMTSSAGAWASADLSSCSSLAPNNHVYHVIVRYDIAHGKDVKRFVGIEDETSKELSKAEAEKVRPFVDCIKASLG